jgi:hypothetical protein
LAGGARWLRSSRRRLRGRAGKGGGVRGRGEDTRGGGCSHGRCSCLSSGSRLSSGHRSGGGAGGGVSDNAAAGCGGVPPRDGHGSSEPKQARPRHIKKRARGAAAGEGCAKCGGRLTRNEEIYARVGKALQSLSFLTHSPPYAPIDCALFLLCALCVWTIVSCLRKPRGLA